MLKFDQQQLTAAALKVAAHFRCSDDCTAGGVGAAVLAVSGQFFTGICIDANCSLGFCAEHAAIAEMLKARKTQIVAIVAVREDGQIVPPCGRCRELIRQIDPANWNTSVILSNDVIAKLCELLPRAEPAAPLQAF